MEYLLHSIITILLLALIVLVCALFTNAIENFGKEYNLQDGAIGGILAAIGTALPETIVPLVAIFGAVITNSEINLGEEIALGAVLGSPFLLSTIAFFITGISIVICSKTKKRICELCSNPIVLLRDLKYFTISYTIAITCAFIPNKTIKYFIACLLFLYYLHYVLRTLKKDFGCDCDNNEIEELLFKKALQAYKNKKILIILQLLIAFGGLIILAHYFVNEIKYFSNILNIHPMIMSLILTPIATELPECLNSAIWISSSKDTLSIANITGALVFQSCIPTAIGIAFTPWVFTTPAILSVILVYCAIGTVYTKAIKNKGILNYRILIYCGIFYLIYVAYILKMLI